jgi:hypothetical protein
MKTKNVKQTSNYKIVYISPNLSEEENEAKKKEIAMKIYNLLSNH